LYKRVDTDRHTVPIPTFTKGELEVSRHVTIVTVSRLT